MADMRQSLEYVSASATTEKICKSSEGKLSKQTETKLKEAQFSELEVGFEKYLKEKKKVRPT